MTDFEKFVKENRELFDDQEPYPGHFKRFRMKNERRYVRRRGYLSIAAAFIAGIILASAMYRYLSFGEDKQALSELSPQVKETLYYYDLVSRDMIEEIREMPVDDGQLKKKVLNDVERNDQTYQQLLGDLRKYPGDERVIHALIEYHRSRAEMLRYILQQLGPENTDNIKKL